jgi:hypothetical protein
MKLHTLLSKSKHASCTRSAPFTGQNTLTKPRWGRYFLTPWYWPTLTKSRAALNMDQHMQELAQLSISANTFGRLAQLWYRRYSLSFDIGGTHSAIAYAETCLAVHTCRHVLRHAWLRHTSWNMMCSWYLPTYEYTRPALHMRNTCKHMHTSPYKPTNADKCTALDKSQKIELMFISQ